MNPGRQIACSGFMKLLGSGKPSQRGPWDSNPIKNLRGQEQVSLPQVYVSATSAPNTTPLRADV